MYRWIKNLLTDRTIATQTESHKNNSASMKGYRKGAHSSCTLYTLYSNDIVKYLPDTYAALYADAVVHVWSGRQADSMLQRIEMAMHIWTRKPINPSLRTARSIYVIFVNSMPCYNSDRGERTLHSVLQPRGDIYESGVTSTRLRTRLNERCRHNYRTDIFVILAFQMYAINLSIHLDIGSAKHRRLFTASNVAETLGKENCATLLAFYVFSGYDCTMQCIQGKIPLRQLEKNPRFHIAYRQLGVEWYIQQETLEQLEQFTCLIH